MRMKQTNKPSHVTEGSVFEDLGFSAEEAAVLRLKTKLHLEIVRVVKKQQLSSRDLEKLLDVPQPRVSELLGGKIANVSVDKLAKYLHRLGREVCVVVKRASKMHGSEVA